MTCGISAKIFDVDPQRLKLVRANRMGALNAPCTALHLCNKAEHRFFDYVPRRRLRELFRVGRTSLLIGLVALASAIALGDFLAGLMKGRRIGEIVRESFTRRLGFYVASSRDLLVRLVADSR